MKNHHHHLNRILVCAALALFWGSGLSAQNIYGNRELQQKLIGGIGLLPDVEPPALTPEEAQAYERITQMADQNPSQAIDELRQVTTEDSNAQFNFLLATLYYTQNKHNNAVAQFRAAIQKWPTFRRAYQSLGVLLILQNQYREAQQYLTKVIELGGGNAEIYNFLGTAYIFDENFTAAESAYRQALLLAPGSDQFKLSLVRVLFSQEKWEEADALLGAMLLADPTNTDAWSLQANTFLGREQFLEAAANWEILRAMNALDPETLGKLATVYVSEQLYDVAADRYLEAFEKSGGVAVEEVLKAAEELLARGASTQAEQLLTQVRTSETADLSDADRQQVLRLEAKLLIQQDRADEAAEILEKVVQQNPTDGDSLLQLGQYYRSAGQPEQAQFFFERASMLENEDYKADALIRLAQLKAEDFKEYGEALDLLKQAQDVKYRPQVEQYIKQIEQFQRNR